jgi:hypothetical protein
MKRFSRLPAILIFSALVPAQGDAQGGKVVYEPTLGVAEQAYREAQEAWLNEDSNLSADLLTGKAADVHKRISRKRALSDDMMDKKVVYFDQIIKRFAEMRGRLAGTGSSQLPIPELRKGLEVEQSKLLEDQDRLDALIRDLPQGDEYALVMRELAAERTDLVNLQNTVAQRIRSVDQMEKAQQVGVDIEAKDPLEKKLDAIQTIYNEERERAKRQKPVYDQIYLLMDRAVDEGKAPAVNKPAPKPDPKPDKVKLPPQASRTAVPVGFSGIWFYESHPGAWTGFGEPVSVGLSLRSAGEQVTGSYIARLPGKNDVRDLSLTLTGEEISPGIAKVSWVSQMPPAKGEMMLRLGGDRRVLVERTASNDTYFPRGMEVLLPR